VVAQVSWIVWRRVGWLSLSWTISVTIAAAATSNSFLAVQGIEGDDGAGANAAFGQQHLCRRNFVGLVGNVDVGEHEGGIGGERAQHLGGCAVAEAIEAATQGLAVKGDATLPWHGPPRLQLDCMAAESGLHVSRIKSLKGVADSGVGWGAAPFQREGLVG